MLSTTEILSDLTPEQQRAVTHREGPMLVIAGAGSGKTRVVTRRIAWLISQGVWPNQILAMTFTNKAAREMRERVNALTGEDFHNIGTFHSLCARFLRRDIDKIHCGRDRNFTIFDSSEQQGIMKDCLKKRKIDLKTMSAGKVLGIISTSKNTALNLEEAAYKLTGSSRDCDLIQALAGDYEDRLRRLNGMDFDDLLLLVVRMLRDYPELKEIYHNRYRYVLIDEYQDTNHLQYELMQLLLGEQKNIHVTGDPDQCIYTWRNADYRNIMDFEKDFPDAEVVCLEQNYRSSQTILEAANQVITHNTVRYDKTLFTENDIGWPVCVVHSYNDLAEAEFVCRMIRNWQEEYGRLKDVAIFYRTNMQSRTLEEALIRESIPYQLFGGLRFYDRQEVKDLLAFLRIRVNPSDDISLKRMLKITGRSIGDKTREKFAARALELGMPVFTYLCSRQFQEDFCSGKSLTAGKYREFAGWCRGLQEIPLTPVSQAVQDIWDYSGLEAVLEKAYLETNLEDRLDNIGAFAGKAREFEDKNPEGDLNDFLQDVALVSDIDAHDPDQDSVSLMTLHSAKGLEFPLVFITGVERDVLPHINSMQDDAGIEEERRLFFVGITRARKALFITYADGRYKFGRFESCFPSEFLKELPQNIVQKKNYFGSSSCRRSSRW